MYSHYRHSRKVSGTLADLVKYDSALLRLMVNRGLLSLLIRVFSAALQHILRENYWNTIR